MAESLIVSMASYPPRIKTVSHCIRGLLAQSVRPDRILVWLYEGEFPNGRDDLPRELLDLEGGIVEICWAPENLKPHNKYFWTFLANPDATVITVDDDLEYSPTMIEELLVWHKEFPDAVIANRTHLILLRGDGSVAPYGEWLPEQDAVIGRPSYALMATNGAGSLFPAGSIPEAMLDSERIKSTCLHADDLWLKLLELKLGISVVATGHADLSYIPGTQDCGLWLTVNINGGNDKVLKCIGDELANHTEALRDDLLKCCVDVFSVYRRYQQAGRELAIIRSARQIAEERAATLSDELESQQITMRREREEALLKERSLNDEIARLRAEDKRSAEAISNLRALNAKYEERLKTPYAIRAVLNILRRAKKSFGS